MKTTGMSGTLIAICGPSGAGKDTVLRLAKAALDGHPGVHFTRRVITRAAGSNEDNEGISPEDFALRAREGQFLLHWQAHGLSYGLPVSLLDQMRAGTCGIANVSRGVLGEIRRLGVAHRIVEITASPEVLAERLAGRGREAGPDQAARLERNTRYAGQTRADHIIINNGAPEQAAAEFVAIIRAALAREPEKTA
ncbi:MAG: phosphonate metabolism protein/1,5-bisphosphokinase (PRPP-forming) PhnN [Proteobacteria bacterium]|nr:phosphonate metabolism protein/1,5-bisphosphokinase (PRPP-forming) PhnN [Pseudomonadota bacterium]